MYASQTINLDENYIDFLQRSVNPFQKVHYAQ